MLLRVECILLALSVIARAQPTTPGSTGPSPNAAPSPTGPQSISDCDPAPPGDPYVIIDGQDGNTVAGIETVYAQSDGGYIIGKQTLERGSQITVSQTTYSLGPKGMVFVVDGRASTIAHGAGGGLPDFDLPIDYSCGAAIASSTKAGDTATKSTKTGATSTATAPRTSNASTRSDTSGTSAALITASTQAITSPATSSTTPTYSSASSTSSIAVTTGTSNAATIRQATHNSTTQLAIVLSLVLVLISGLMYRTR